MTKISGLRIIDYRMVNNLGYLKDYTQNDWIADSIGNTVRHYLKDHKIEVTGGFTIKLTKIKQSKNSTFDCKQFDDLVRKELSKEFMNDILDWRTSINNDTININIQLETGKSCGGNSPRRNI